MIVGAMLITSVQDVIFKLFSSALPLGQIFVLRAMLAILLLMVLAAVHHVQRGLWAQALSRWVLLRSALMTLFFLAFYGSIPFASLAVLGAGAYTAPIFVVLLAAYFSAEPVGFRGWIAVAIGFAGVLFLLQPGTEAFSIWALPPVVGAGFYAMAHVITRLKCRDVSTVTLALSLKLAIMAGGLLASLGVLLWQPDQALVAAYPYLLGRWQPVSQQDWGILCILAVLTVAIGLSIAGAYKAAQPTTVATFEYSYLVFAVAWDILVFQVVPGMASALGLVMIAGAGWLAMHPATVATARR
ncbi:hypothetical protein RA29_00410 [Tateyamaria sp. ANG-S1]|nr:hypothetical protein RA29_00410 [Tateyamaria sp. ANG-S1]